MLPAIQIKISLNFRKILKVNNFHVSQLNFKNGNRVERHFIRTTVIHPCGASCAHYSFVCFFDGSFKIMVSILYQMN